MPAPPSPAIRGIPDDRVESLRGKKVLVAMRSFHNVCGILVGLRTPRLVVTVEGREVLLELSAIKSLNEVPALQAEFVR